MSKTRVVVTGLGATTPLGGDVASTWEALLAGRSGVGKLTWENVEELPVRIGAEVAVEPADSGVLTEDRMSHMDRCEQFALIAVREAMNDAGYGYADENGLRVDPDRLGVVLPTSVGGLDSALANYKLLCEKGWEHVSTSTFPMLMPNGSAAMVGIEYQALAGNHALVSACASSAEAVGYGIDMIRSGRADVVIVGGTEANIQPLQLASFGQMRAMSTRNDDPEGASRPFDKNRDGFVFGEAGAMMIIETEEHAKARGAKPLARIMGAGITSDAFHMVAPAADGLRAGQAMKRAMETAGLSPEDINHVNAHATSTSIGDTAEANAIRVAGVDHAAVYAPKSALGHSIGAVGALESILTVLSLRDGVIPPTLNYETPDPEIDLDVVAGEPRYGDYQYAINNSFGFGGHNVALAFGRY